MRQRRNENCIKSHFQAFMEYVVLPFRTKCKKAAALYVQQTKRRYFRWLCLFTVMSKKGTLRKEWKKPPRFERHHNLRKIDAHYHRVLIQKTLREWRRVAHVHAFVRRRFQKIISDRYREMLRTWSAQSKLQVPLIRVLWVTGCYINKMGFRLSFRMRRHPSPTLHYSTLPFPFPFPFFSAPLSLSFPLSVPPYKYTHKHRQTYFYHYYYYYSLFIIIIIFFF